MSDLLSTIHSPQDLQSLNASQLTHLAAELRQRIIGTMSINGGHLASNLGSVELTIALHRVFNSPQDKLIWDVSHQTYSHKILTGRNNQFDTIRKHKGLCGFGHPKESPHDHFFAGHAGTALSLALGVAKNRDLSGRHDHVIPIIGDATLTCGMSLEALNNIPQGLKRFIVILNDNAMSISKNVGAITHILSRLISNPTLNKLHHDLDSYVSKIPTVGNLIAKQGHKLTGSLKNLVSPAVFFEQYGLSYIGPVDGHDIKMLIETFQALKEYDWPVIVHVLTNKGQGMDVAIQNPVSYHGVKPFDMGTGKFLPSVSTKPTFPKVFGNHMLKMVENDPNIVIITPAMSAGSMLDEVMKKFPDRCLDVGIAEGHSVTFAGGIAYGGNIKAVTSIYSTFFQRAFDNLFHDVCLQEIPVVFAVDRAGLAGPDGSTHNGIYDISFLNAMPNMVICQPRNGQLLKELLESSFSWKRPTAIRYPNLTTEDSDLPLIYRKLGKGEIIAEGSDILIIGLGHMLKTAMELRELLIQDGRSATVLDPIFVKPLDTELLSTLLLTHQQIVTIEDHSLASGLGSIINNFLVKQGFRNISVSNFGIPEVFVEQGTHEELFNELGLTAKKIYNQLPVAEEASVRD